MKRTIKRVLSLFMLITLGFCCLVGCSSKNDASLVATDDVQGNNELVEMLSTNSKKTYCQFNEGVVLVKTSCFDASMLGELRYESVEQLYKNSLWYEVELSDKDATEEAVSYLLELDTFDKVDYDYIMGSDGTIESIDVSSNPYSTEQGYLDAQGIFDGWGYAKAENKAVGGSPDVVVAIIDTGVDYNHLDLRNNIWTNSGEIPNNGVDDDGNGYVDDYYGWDCVGNDNDPMDDNGHGTHVAGIVAAENNAFGTVGVAFNCKVMCIKAGNSTGYFNNSDIAEAIQYAYMNGASVINMSFGGSSISTAVKDALEDAYNQCVLVAAAGNDGLCNNLMHSLLHPVGVAYPAALPYVIGVMSTNSTGTLISAFSNYDDTPYNNVEYEVYACGEQIPSTWPNNKIARLSGTSMACPVVAGIAALLRSNYSDREVYSNKFIQSQIVNTGTINPYNALLKESDEYHTFANVYDAITKLPKPNVSLYDSYIFDDKKFSPANNGNGIAEAGETIHLAIELHNRGGVASNINVSINTIRNGDPSLTDPYLSIEEDSFTLSDIGTYSIRDCGIIYDENNNAIDAEKHFIIKIGENCPNGYKSNVNVVIQYKNGLDDNDLVNYEETKVAVIDVSSGFIIPETIIEDTTFSADKLYIIKNDVVISSGATVTFEEGCRIQVYTESNSYYGNIYNSPQIKVYGNLIFNGTKENPIELYVADSFYNCPIIFTGSGIEMRYVNSVNVIGGIGIADHCFFDQSCDIASNWNRLVNGELYHTANSGTYLNCALNIGTATNSIFKCEAYSFSITVNNSDRNYYYLNTMNFVCLRSSNFVNNVVKTFYSGTKARSTSYLCGTVQNNVFMGDGDNNPDGVGEFNFSGSNISSNKFDAAYKNYASSLFVNYYTSNGIPTVDVNGDCSDLSSVYPHIVSVNLTDENGTSLYKVGKEPFNVNVVFSTSMDIEKDVNVYFGTIYPYADYAIKGTFVSPIEWVGAYSLKAFIENGKQLFSIRNGEDLSGNRLYKEIGYFSFDIDTTSALSMNLQAYASNMGINLEWAQDDYDTLMGYNVYRSAEKDGYFAKLNNAVIPAGENSFVDENAEPGVTYWYTFTVVFSDMTESAPAGRVSCTAADTIAPSIYHTPVNQGYLSNNLVISCTASDNIGIASVNLYYRTKGTETWKNLSMSKQNDRYSATVFGSDLSLDGLEYYIVASDGFNTINKGTAENPYSVIVKDASSISRLGDVDGDGVITTKDALMIMQSINGDLLLTDDQFKRADLNNDGVLSSVEALRILQYINGNVSTLEM